MVIFLYGPDTYRSREKLLALKNKFICQDNKKGFNISSFTGNDLTIDELRKAILTSSLFAKKRMLIIEEFFSTKTNQKQEELIKEITKYLNKNRRDDDNIVIFWDTEINLKELTPSQRKLYELLKNEKYSQEFLPLKPYQIKIWIKKEANQRKIKIEDRAVELLLATLGANLWALKNELDKLTAYSEGSFISLGDVEKIVLTRLEQNIWKLVDALGDKNKKLSLCLLSDQIKAGASMDWILSMLIYEFRIILKIKSFLTNRETPRPTHLAKMLSLHPYVLQKGLAQEKNYTLQELKKIYQGLLKIDVSRKTRPINPEVLLDLLLIKG